MDEALYEPNDLIHQFGNVPAEYTGWAGEEWHRIQIENIKISVPIELDVYQEGAEVSHLGAATEIYDYQTSFGSVLYQLSLTFQVEHEQEKQP